MGNYNYDLVFLGLSITSSWGNGHATTYRALIRELSRRGHRILFLERDLDWYRQNRDMPCPSFCRTELYGSFEELRDRFTEEIQNADMVIQGSYVRDGVMIGQWINQIADSTAFYDIDTPVTLAKLRRGDNEYLSPELISQFDLYLSFTGGPALKVLEKKFGAKNAKPLYCSVDPQKYYPEDLPKKYDLGYLGTYSDDRQPMLEKLLLTPARKWPKGEFFVAGPMYPDHIQWPENVKRENHLPPDLHRDFYNSQKFTLNVTRTDMVTAGYSPSVRLFEAAACGTPIISDYWTGLDEFFDFGKELLVSFSPEETLNYIKTINEEQRHAIGQRARKRILNSHTAAHRAAQLDHYIWDVFNRKKVYHLTESVFG